jgi:hypothetical protein
MIRTRAVLRTTLTGKKLLAQQLTTKLEQSQDAPRKRNKSHAFREMHGHNTPYLTRDSARGHCFQQKSKQKRRLPLQQAAPLVFLSGHARFFFLVCLELIS